MVDMYIVMTSGHINCVESGGGGEHEEFCSLYLQSRNLFGVLKLECIREGDEKAKETS